MYIPFTTVYETGKFHNTASDELELDDKLNELLLTELDELDDELDTDDELELDSELELLLTDDELEELLTSQNSICVIVNALVASVVKCRCCKPRLLDQSR